MGAHIIDGEFQSDKYEWCLPGFVPLKLTDPMAQPFLWAYAEERRSIDAEFADDLQEVLRLNGYNGAKEKESNGVDSEPVSRVVRATCMAPTCAWARMRSAIIRSGSISSTEVAARIASSWFWMAECTDANIKPATIA